VTLYDVYVVDNKVNTSPDKVETLAPGATATFTASYTITQDDVDNNAVITNVAYATDGTTNSNNDSWTVTEYPKGCLTIVKEWEEGYPEDYVLPNVEVKVTGPNEYERHIELNDDNGWSYTISDLPVGTYYANEEPIEGWLSSNDGPAEVAADAGAAITITNTMKRYCDTAWAYGNLENWDYTKTNNWGWSNGPLSIGIHEYPVYAGAGQNDPSKGAWIGNATIDYDGSSVTVTFEPFDGVEVDSGKVYVGGTPLKKSAPGQFPYKVDDSVKVKKAWDDVYVAVHFDSCRIAIYDYPDANQPTLDPPDPNDNEEPGTGDPETGPPTVEITSPADGDTVGGESVLIEAKAAAFAGSNIKQVEFFVDGESLGTDTDRADGWSYDWDSTGVTDGNHTIKATATDSQDQSSDHIITIIVENVLDEVNDEEDQKIAVDGLTAESSWVNKATWNVSITIKVDPALADAVVTGKSSTGVTVTGTTDANGICVITLTKIHNKNNSIDFTVNDIALAGYVFAPDSTKDTITVNKPK